MDAVDHNALEILLWSLGGLNTVFLMFASWAITSFRAAIDKLEETDKALENRVNVLEVAVARLEENTAARAVDIKTILEKLDRVEQKLYS